MTYRSLIEFNVQKGKGEEFERVYIEGGMLDKAKIIPGFISGDFMRKTIDPPVFMATVEWEAAEDYASWQAAYDTALPQDIRMRLGKMLLKPPETSILCVCLQKVSR
jgi:heme-degrading monooxygenase HmoA